ncbi:hypothetical protein GmRootA79_46650 [Acidovorax sp. A79]
MVLELSGLHVPNDFCHEFILDKKNNIVLTVSTDHKRALENVIGPNWEKLGIEFTQDFAGQVFSLMKIPVGEIIKCEESKAKEDSKEFLDIYRGFSSASALLGEKEAIFVPHAAAYIALAISRGEQWIRPVRIGSFDFGRTTEGALISDFTPSGTLNIKSTHRRTSDELMAGLENARQLLHPSRSAALKHFALALGENDVFKKFIYGFLSIEVETHRIFKTVDHSSEINSLLSTVDKFERVPVAEMFASDFQSKVKNIGDRFVWCALSKWPHLGNSDIAVFKELKSIRDKIAHGELSVPPAGAAKRAEALARKILFPTSVE